jgi:hypothetical protein
MGNEVGNIGVELIINKEKLACHDVSIIIVTARARKWRAVPKLTSSLQLPSTTTVLVRR